MTKNQIHFRTLLWTREHKVREKSINTLVHGFNSLSVPKEQGEGYTRNALPNPI